MSVSFTFWAVSILGSSSTHPLMFDLPNTEATPLLALVPAQGKPENHVLDSEMQNVDRSTLQAFLPITLFQYSRYFSTESWLLSETSAAQAYLSITSVLSEPAPSEPTLAQLTPLNLADSLEPWATFMQGPMPTSSITTRGSAELEAQASTVEHWVAIADVRVVSVAAASRETNLNNLLLANCTALSTTAAAATEDQATLPRFQVWLKDHYLGDVSTAAQAEALAQTVRQLIRQDNLEPNAIYPLLVEPRPAVKLDEELLFPIHDGMAQELGYSPEWAAITWANRLRQALGAPPLDAGTVQMALEGFEESDVQLQGTASWYGPYFHGRLTATGETFDQNQLTVAHKTLPFGTLLKVRNLRNDRTVVVRVNDRGPYIDKRSLDLSRAAAQCLGSEQVGIIPYEAVILEKSVPDSEVLTSSSGAVSLAKNN